MIEGHLFSAPEKLIGITATDKESMKQRGFFHDIRVKPRKRVLEILVNENSKPNIFPLLQLYKSKSLSCDCVRSVIGQALQREPPQSHPTAPAVRYLVPGKGQSTY